MSIVPNWKHQAAALSFDPLKPPERATIEGGVSRRPQILFLRGLHQGLENAQVKRVVGQGFGVPLHTE